MSGVLRRSSNGLHILEKLKITHFIGDPVAQTPHCPLYKTQSRLNYNRLPPFPRKTREHNGFSAAMFSSTSSSSSTTSTASTVGFVSWYLGMVKSRPIITKSVTCSIIFTAADLTSQTITRSSSDPYDVLRTLRMTGYGMLILGPCHHFWFTFMARIFPKQDVVSTLKKLFIGQTLYGLSITALFFCVNSCLRGENSAEVAARLKRDLAPTLIRGVMYWSVCDFITLKFFPVHLQVLMTNTFSFMWTIYLSYMASLEKVAMDTS